MVHECKYMYVHCTDTSVQLHNHTSLSIRPNRLCDAGESLSQLRAGYASLLLVISLHVHTLYIRCSSLFILVCSLYILVCTCHRHVHPVDCLYMVHLGSSWFTALMYAVCTRLYSAVPPLNNAIVQESAIWYRQGSYRYVPS